MRAAEQTASDGSDAECTKQQAECCWATPDKVAGHKRHKSLDGAAGETEHERANQNHPDPRRHGHKADPGAHGSPKGFRRQPPSLELRPPAEEDEDQDKIAEGVHGESGRRSSNGNDDSTERRANAARDVHAHAAESDRLRQILTGHHVSNRGLPSWIVNGSATADQESEDQQAPGGDQPKVGASRQHDRDSDRKDLRHQHHGPFVVVIRDRAGRQREQHDRQGGRGLNQRHEAGRACQRSHQPRGSHGLDEPAEIGDQESQPHRPEGAMPEGRKGRRTGIGVLSAGNGSLQRENSLACSSESRLRFYVAKQSPLYTGFS